MVTLQTRAVFHICIENSDFVKKDVILLAAFVVMSACLTSSITFFTCSRVPTLLVTM